jgi:hypothetical protein
MDFCDIFIRGVLLAFVDTLQFLLKLTTVRAYYMKSYTCFCVQSNILTELGNSKISSSYVKVAVYR